MKSSKAATTEQPGAGPTLTIDCDDCGQVVAVPRDGEQAACGCSGVLWSLSPSRVKLSREQDAKITALEAERDRMEITTARVLTENMALTAERDDLAVQYVDALERTANLGQQIVALTAERDRLREHLAKRCDAGENCYVLTGVALEGTA